MGWAKKACVFLVYFASQRPSLGYVPFPAKAPDTNLETTSSPTKESSKARACRRAVLGAMLESTYMYSGALIVHYLLLATGWGGSIAHKHA